MAYRQLVSLAFGGLILLSALPEHAFAQAMRVVMAGSSSGGTAHLYFASLAPLLNK